MNNWNRMQVGNFIIEKIDMDGMEFMEVRSVGNEWRVMYREDTMMYNMIASVKPTDNETRQSLSVIINNIYAVSTVIEGQLQHEIVEAVYSFIERAETSKLLSKEEDDKVLDEMKTEHEMKELYGKTEQPNN